ncbi:hypothetical protein [Ectobacillus funiculus]|uniref:Uncharacterized protein n=1 Tax=Ectobacillus funiculus TaxID=137993 RepID=A0ABV5W9A9_9BACI
MGSYYDKLRAQRDAYVSGFLQFADAAAVEAINKFRSDADDAKELLTKALERLAEATKLKDDAKETLEEARKRHFIAKRAREEADIVLSREDLVIAINHLNSADFELEEARKDVEKARELL